MQKPQSLTDMLEHAWVGVKPLGLLLCLGLRLEYDVV